MQSNIAYNMGLFKPHILIVVLFMITYAIASLLLTHSLKWKSRALKAYGIFIGMKMGRQLALAAIILRMLFVWSLVLFGSEITLSHIIYGVMLSMLIHIILADLQLFVFDMLILAILYGGIFVSKMLYSYINNIQTNVFIIIMLIVIGLFIITSSIYCAIECIGCMVKPKSISKYKEKLRGSIVRRLYLMMVGVFVFLIPYIYINRIDVYHTNQEVFQYSSLGKTSYKGKSKITKSKDIGLIENNNELIKLNKTPLYFSEEDKIIIPSIYSIIQPSLALTNRIGVNTRVYTDDGKYYIDSDKSKIRLSDFFLFDGRDTYIFFENATISWDEETIELSPFSYITVRNNKYIEIFDREAEEYRIFETGISNVTARLIKGASINLSTDILIRSNGQEQFLFLQPNLLEDLQ